MPEQIQNHTPAQVFKAILLVVVLLALGWCALTFLFAAAKTIVILALAMVLAYFVIRLLLGRKR